MKKVVIFLLVAGLVVWALMREQQAEDRAREFCDSVAVGERFDLVSDRARSVGEDQLRIVRDESVIVGFTGIPPFSRHACEVTSEGGVVSGKRYVHID